MKRLRDLRGAPLEWAQTGMLERSYELRSNDSIVATLEWEKLWGTLATARTADGSWTFKRSGFLTPQVTARVLDSDRDAFVYRAAWGFSGTLTGGAELYEWKQRSLWNGTWGFSRSNGALVVEYLPKFNVLTRKVDVEIPGAFDHPDLPLLVTLGWYLMILALADSTAATVAAIS